MGYVVTPWIGDVAQPVGRFESTATTQIVGGLRNGLTYTFTVQAIDANHDLGAPSEHSDPVIPGRQVDAGGRTCALAAGGAVKCWGDGNPTPTAVPGLTGATAVSVGSSPCALISDGTVKCWGSNSYGQLGNGTYTDSATPVTVLGITDATAIAARTVAACALLSSGSVKCWGHHFSGAGGLEGDWTHTPWTVPGINDASTIEAGASNTCAVVTGGAVKCWGNDISDGQGGSTGFSWNDPIAVPGISGATLVTSGGDHFCARLPGGVMKCWGQAYQGQLGDGTGGAGEWFNPVWTPVSVVGMTGARVITAGTQHTCAITEGGTAKCWGRNDQGQVGNGTSGYPYPNTPSSVVDLSNAIALDAGGYNTCAVVPDAVLCWGSNTYGQLGTGTAAGLSTTPVEVVGL